MTAKSFKNLAAPVVIALMVLGFAAYELWLSPAPKSAPTPAPPSPEIALPAPAPPPASSGPLETPVAAVWSTYHGGPDLAGYAETSLPDEPVVRWRYQADGPVYFTPVADDLGVYVSTRNAKVCALDFLGKERWTRQLMREKGPDGVEKPERIEAPLACFLSMVFAGTTSGKLYALEAATGEVKWVYDVEGTILGTVNLQPAQDAAEPNRLFVISQDDGVLHCVDAATGKRLWAAEPIERCDGSAAVARGLVIYGSCAAALHVFSAGDGKILQNIALDADSQVAGGAALAGDSIYSGSHSGYFYHADSRTSRVLWVNKDSEGEVFSTPALSPDLVVFSSSDGNVYGLDRRSGMRKWTFTTDGTPTSAVIAGSKVVLGVDGVLQILKLDTGEAIWSQEISDEIASPAIIREMVVVGGGDGTVTAFGAPAG